MPGKDQLLSANCVHKKSTDGEESESRFWTEYREPEHEHSHDQLSSECLLPKRSADPNPDAKQ